MILARETEYWPDPAPLARAAGRERRPALFHSGLAGGPWARWTVFALDPCAILRIERPTPGAFDDLRRFLACRTIQTGSDDSPEARALPFVAGAAGFIGYDLGAVLEPRLPAPRSDRLRVPRAWLGFYPAAYVADHETR
ncbi:MAG: hypothetical protein NTW86_26685, partial [Candidatus Sumerlaeota bacterium]|nr:hypothetical protein [Candidatus Sumerlaeota bacterium]